MFKQETPLFKQSFSWYPKISNLMAEFSGGGERSQILPVSPSIHQGSLGLLAAQFKNCRAGIRHINGINI